MNREWLAVVFVMLGLALGIFIGIHIREVQSKSPLIIYSEGLSQGLIDAHEGKYIIFQEGLCIRAVKDYRFREGKATKREKKYKIAVIDEDFIESIFRGGK